MDDKKKRIEELVERLNRASNAYYGGQEEQMTNFEWDALFDELKKNQFIDDKNYFIGFSDAFINAFQNAPSNFPNFNALSMTQKTTVLGEINLSVSDHHMYSDFNKMTLRFLNTQCQ